MSGSLRLRRTAVCAFSALLCACACASASAAPVGGRFQVRHVFVIVLENESAAVTFGPDSPAPYLSSTLPSRGVFVPNYYGIGHASLDNYIAMISGQAPNPSTQADCGVFANFATPGPLGSFGQQPGSGCVYPSDVPTLPSQLATAGFTWRSYDEDMGADPTRESATCGHPVVGQPDHTEAATPSDMYASRHDPFVYFHSIIDSTGLCNSHVVNLHDLAGDLSHVSSTRNYTFITPNLCNDGHDATCANGQTGGLPAADAFLKTWVPMITASQAFKEDGLLMVIFDEATGGDSSSCCGELPAPAAPEPGGTGPGGGRTGAVLLSRASRPRRSPTPPYNHYTMLGSVENIFGRSHLGYAGLPHSTYFGSDIYKRQCGPSPPRVAASRRSSCMHRTGGCVSPCNGRSPTRAARRWPTPRSRRGCPVVGGRSSRTQRAPATASSRNGGQTVSRSACARSTRPGRPADEPLGRRRPRRRDR